MADIMHNLIEFKNKDSYEEFKKLYVSKGHDKDGDYDYFDFNKVIPEPTCEADAPNYFFNSGVYRHKGTWNDMTGKLAPLTDELKDFDWWHWEIDNWGVKWDTTGAWLDDENHEIYFDNAWYSPVLVFDKIAEQNPGLWRNMDVYSILEFNGHKYMAHYGGTFDPNECKNYIIVEPRESNKREPRFPVGYYDTNEEHFEFVEDWEEAFPKGVKILKHFGQIDSVYERLPSRDVPIPEREVKWKIGETTLKLHTPIWDVMETEKTSPTGKVGKFVSLKTPDWVKAIIYNTKTRKFVITREFRQGINDYDIAFPSGTVEPGEDPMDAVKREVTEETGFKNITRCELLGSYPPNVAFMNNTMYIYYLEVDGEKTDRNLDEFEDIDMFEVNHPMDYPIKGQTDTLGWYRYKDVIHDCED